MYVVFIVGVDGVVALTIIVWISSLIEDATRISMTEFLLV